MKTRVYLLLLLGFSYLSVMADHGGEINIVLEGYITSYENAKTIDVKVKTLSKIIIEGFYIDFNISKSYLKVLENLAVKSDHPLAYIHFYKAKGILAYSEEKPLDSILVWYSKSLDVIRKSNIIDKSLEIAIINNKAIAYEQNNKLNLAINEYIAGLDVLHGLQERNYGNETAFYANISGLLLNAKRYEEALHYILKAEESDEIITSKTSKKSNYFEYISNNKAEILYHLGRIGEAQKILINMLDYGNKVNITNNYGKIVLGQIYADQNKTELSRATLTRALEEANHLDLGITNPVFASMNMAKLELKEDNPTTALEHMDFIFSLYHKEDKEIKDPDIFKTMAMVLERSSRFKESLQYNKQYQRVLIEKLEQENTIKFEEIEQKLTKVETEAQQKLQEDRITKLIVAFFLSTLLLFIIYYLYSRKEEHNKNLIKNNKEITIAKDKALAAAKSKENFLSVMSHEMRTPLNAIIGISNILLDENVDQRQKEHLLNLKFSGEGLLHIINEVLDFSKIEAYKLKIIKTEFNLSDFLDSITNALKHGNCNTCIEIFQDQQLSNLKHIVHGDHIRINQILTNLLGNAIKFTREGHIILRSEILASTENTVTVNFQVEDTGIGIPEEMLETIFESFSQVNNKLNRVHEGTGLGLGISKKLVELHGGTLDVKSTQGEGSTFSFIIQFDKGHAIEVQKKKNLEKTNSKIFKSGIEGKRILLVEDNKLNQIVALKVLEKFKTVTSLAQNGQEAVDMVSNNEYDLILMDIHMPIMDGLEATETIRQLTDDTKNRIPIIALSADAYSNKVKEATKCGMNDYLAKPFKPEELFQKIQKNLESNTPLRA